MRALRGAIPFLLAGAALVAGVGSTRAGGALGQPVAPTPHQVVAERTPILRTTVDDAEALLEQVRRLAANRPPQEAARGERPDRAVSRLIRLDAPPVVNHGSSFVFRDATRRDDAAARPPAGAVRSLKDRHAAVEAWRRELVRRKEREGAAR